MDLSSLSSDDAADFEKRLSVYGLGTDAIIRPELTVQRNSVVHLSMSSETFIRPHVLRPTDFDTLKAWIGVPDQLARALPFDPARLPRPLRRTASKVEGIQAADRPGRSASRRKAQVADVDRSELGGMELNNVRMAARAYLRGDSRLVGHYKTIVDQFYVDIRVPIWAFLRIFVASGSVLEFGPGPNVLVAHEVVVEEGGEIRSAGHLNVSCTILKKQLPFVHPGVIAGIKNLAVASGGEG